MKSERALQLTQQIDHNKSL